MLYAFWPSLLFSSIFGVILTFLQFIIPFLILMFCYAKIIWMLSRRINSNSESGGNQSVKFELARTNTIKIFLLIGIDSIICWSGNSIFYLMYNLGYHADFSSNFAHFTVIIMLYNQSICLPNRVQTISKRLDNYSIV